jgi:UDP-N-acetylglucosamine:LPS N-acetylglucosamine transferase
MAGGSRTYEIANFLAKKGFEVVVIASTQIFKKKTIQKFHNIKIIWLPLKYLNSYSFTKRIFVYTKFSLIASIEASKISCDITYAKSTPLTIFIPAFISKIFNKSKIICNNCNYFIKNIDFYLFYVYICKNE